MRAKFARPVILVSLILFLIPGLFFSQAQGTRLSTTQSQTTSSNTYLPIIIINPQPSSFGVETWTMSTSKSIPMAAQGDYYWMRNFVFDWDLIEATPGIYDWSSVNETGLLAAATSGINVVATVKYTPSWAQKEPPYTCGAIREDALDEFAAFLQELVRRYSGYPYHLRYIEFGNEPDVDPALIYSPVVVYPDYKHIFGCWGNIDDYYYGGGYYAKMLKAAYPAIKAINPSVQVVIGGLLLAKDPNIVTLSELDKRPGRFFEGILRNNGTYDGANYFDIVAFHGYPAWSSTHGLSTDENNDYWKHLGGIVIGKINFLRSVMTKIETISGQPIDKPIMQTEGAVYCWSNECQNPDNMQNFLQDQANYGVILYTRNLAHDVMGTMWYTIESPGWNYSSLLNSDGTPKPVYNSIQFLNEQLYGAKFYAQISIDPYDFQQLRVYEFRGRDRRIWVLWVADLCWEDTASPGYPYQTCEIDPEVEPPTFTIPAGWTQVMDRDGNTIIPINNQLTINDNRPYYILFTP